jgi:uncharacterized protein (DUF1501 family)
MFRRDFLKYAGAAGGLSLLRLGPDAWAMPGQEPAKKRLIVVFLRGAVDGLNVVIPYTESEYYSSRPTIAVARPGQANGALNLDGRFALHPALEPLIPVWKERSVAFVHACGSPDESRSHFEAQAYMETGTPGVRITRDGWMNRVLGALPGKHAPAEALNFGSTIPKILSGDMQVASISAADKPSKGRKGMLDDATTDPVFDRLYSGADPLSVAYREGRAAQTQMMTDLQHDMTEAAGGAPSAKGFPEDAAKLCRLMKEDATIQMAFFGLSGWDTHVRQGAAEGQLASHLKSLGEGLAQMHTGLGNSYRDTVVLVISEFGRTVRENGSGGTDHGHGNVMWVMGGPVKGGKIYGDWPGLSEEDLHEQRDLAVSTDFRSAIGTILQKHLRLTSKQIAVVFPNVPANVPHIDLIAA